MSVYNLRDKADKHDFAEIFEGITANLSFKLTENGKIYSIPIDLTIEGVVLQLAL